MDIILYLINIIQDQRNQISFLLPLICKYIPVKQWAFDDSHSPKEQKYLYKLHYIYREFTVDFFAMDLHSLPKNSTSFSFKKFNPHVLGLVLTYHVNLKLSTRQTAHALLDHSWH